MLNTEIKQTPLGAGVTAGREQLAMGQPGLGTVAEQAGITPGPELGQKDPDESSNKAGGGSPGVVGEPGAGCRS